MTPAEGMASPPSPNSRSILTYALIVITAAILLVFLGYGGLALPLGGFFLFALTGWFIYRYLSSMRGYQDRYTKSGQQAVSQGYIFRLIGLFFAFFYTYFLLLDLFDNAAIAFLITGSVFGTLVYGIDKWMSRNMEVYVEYKAKSHQRFVDSLGSGEGKCMSCQKKMDADEQFCSHCGFERREKKKDTSYAGNQ